MPRPKSRNIPLHSAAYVENFEVVNKLIEYNADINAENMYKSTPLHWVSRGLYFKDGSVLRLLLERGADVNARREDGSTPLHWASQYGALEAVRLLLEHGADVEAVDVDGRTALQVLCVFQEVNQGRRDEITRLLVEHAGVVFGS